MSATLPIAGGFERGNMEAGRPLARLRRERAEPGAALTVRGGGGFICFLRGFRGEAPCSVFCGCLYPTLMDAKCPNYEWYLAKIMNY